MPFIIKGGIYDKVVTVGHHYNDTARTQVEVLDMRGPTRGNFMKGQLKLREQDGPPQGKWFYPHVIEAAWVEE